MNAGGILIAPLLHLSCLCVAPGRVAITGRRYVFVIPHSLFIVAPSTLGSLNLTSRTPGCYAGYTVGLLDDHPASYCSQCKICVVLDPCCADKSEQLRNSHRPQWLEGFAAVAGQLRAWPRLGSPQKDCSFDSIPKHSKASGECTGAWITVTCRQSSKLGFVSTSLVSRHVSESTDSFDSILRATHDFITLRSSSSLRTLGL
jgi:hypothetical protein